jgi:hypothetical protein
VIGAVALTMLAAAGVAVAATQSSSSPAAQEQAYLADLASKLGVTPSALTTAIKAADSDQIDAALAAGRLTTAQASAPKARIQANTSAPVFGYGLGGHRLGGGFGRGGGYGQVDSAALSYLGISAATLRSDLQAGQSLDAIANATPDKSAAGLKAAIVAAQTTALSSEVSSGRITSAQETQRLGDLSSRIDSLLQRTWTAGTGAWAGRNHGGPRMFGSSSTTA